MRFYLSSYRLCKDPEKFSRLFGANKTVGIVMNAIDYCDDDEHMAKSMAREADSLQAIGLTPEFLDLRSYFGKSDELRATVQRLGGLWVVGGNTFILRKAFRQSGLDEILRSLKARSEDFVYAGYSAGVCVITPTLRGIHLADVPDLTPDGYQSEPIWEGLAFIDYCFAPHYDSDHHESSMIDKSIEYFIDHKMLFIALRDGESIVI